MGTVETVGNPGKQKKRRDYGAGAVFQRCDLDRGCPPMVDGPPHPTTGKPTKVRPSHDCRGMWVGRVETGWDEKGLRDRKPVYGKTEGDVLRKLRDLKNQIETHGAPTVSSRMTVKAWSETYLQMIVTRKRPKSYNADATAIKVWINPTIGHKRLDQISPADFRAVENAQRAKGRASSSMLRVHNTLNDMLKRALLDGHPIKPAAFQSPRPSISVSDRDAMTLDQALAVLVEAGKLPHGSRFLVAFMQGARQEEDLGMEWDRVDLTENAAYFDRSWQKQDLPYNIRYDRTSGYRIPDGYEVRQISGATHWVRPKTRKGYRIPPIVEPVRLALMAWKEESADLPNPHNLIWPEAAGRPRRSKTDNKEWYALQEAASVRHPSGRYFTIHEARHTTVTILKELGVSDDVIAEIVGQVKLIGSYNHVRSQRTRQALDQIAERFGLTVPALGSGDRTQSANDSAN